MASHFKINQIDRLMLYLQNNIYSKSLCDIRNQINMIKMIRKEIKDLKQDRYMCMDCNENWKEINRLMEKDD